MLITNIRWDYGECEDIILPTEFEVPNHLTSSDDIAEWLSVETGFCPESFAIEVSMNECPVRRCKGKYRDSQLGVVEFEAGLFLQWGCDYDEFENGPGNFTTAIVELPDGRIVTPRARDIQFLEPFPINVHSIEVY